MNWWYNIPFCLIWVPLLLSSITAILNPKAAKAVMVVVPSAGVIASSYLLYQNLRLGGSFTYGMGGFGSPIGNELRCGPTEAVMALAFCIVLVLSLLGGYKRLERHIKGYRQSLYAVMVLLLMASLMAEVFTNDLFTGYVFIEIMTIAAGGLVAARSNGRTLFGATKYMIMNMLGSGLFLMGLSMLYALTGHLLMSPMHEKLAEFIAAGQYTAPIILAIALISVGIAVKSALYPFHSWLPDAYGTATPASSAMLSSLVSKAYIFLYIKIVLRVIGLDIMAATNIDKVLLLYAFIGIIMGSIDAILEKKLRGMIAFSSVSQIGYIWLGIAINTELGIAAAIFHMITHAMAKSLLFLSGDRLIGASDGDPHFPELRGAGYRSPLNGAIFSIAACSIVGVPFLGGFVSKLYLSNACMALPKSATAIALVVLAVSTVLNAAYLLITVITIYMKPKHEYESKLEHPWFSTTALVVSMLLILVLGILGYPIFTVISDGVCLMI